MFARLNLCACTILSATQLKNTVQVYPSGQNAAYVVKSLQDFAAATSRGVDPKDEKAKMMREIAKRMSAAEMEAVAHYISGLH